MSIPVQSIEDIEIEALLNGIRKRYGYDFTHYSFASLKRRLNRVLEQERLSSFAELLERLLRDEGSFDAFLKHMSITVTNMFRDPEFYRAIREKVVPMLKTYPFAKIWHAGCASGEEVYSMAILLREEGFLDRVRIYATDFNKHALAAAECGVYRRKDAAAYSDNYHAAGGKHKLENYYSDGYDLIKFTDDLKERITFSYHNLVTDGVFGEMNLICCRNVMIYFDRTLQNRVLSLFTDSLRHGGFLGLGSKETLNFTEVKKLFEQVDVRQKIYRKCKVSDAGSTI